MFNAFSHLRTGIAAGNEFRAAQRKNAFHGMLQSQGPQIAAGNPQALGALAQFDPQAAMQVRQLSAEQKEAAAKRLVNMVANSENPAEAYGTAMDYAERLGLNTDALPASWEEGGEDFIRSTAGLYAMPDQERTEFERNLSMLPEGERDKALRVRLGLSPRATEERPQRPPSGYRRDEAGNLAFIPGGPADPQVRAAQRGKGGIFGENGITITEDAEGRPVVQLGGEGQAGSLTRSGLNQVGGTFIDSTSKIDRLNSIAATFEGNPKLWNQLFTYGGQLEFAFLRQMEKLDPDLLSGADIETIAGSSQARQVILDNLNRTIKEITGAAMTNAEAVRIGATEINVNDSPTEARQKLRGALRAARLAQARAHMFIATGGKILEGEKAEAVSKRLTNFKDIAELDREMRAAEQAIRAKADEMVAQGMSGDEVLAALAPAAKRFVDTFGVPLVKEPF